MALCTVTTFHYAIYRLKAIEEYSIFELTWALVYKPELE